jgi:phage-related protein
MTSDASIDVREVIFVNPDAERGYDELPPDVVELADGAVTALQNGRAPVRKGMWRGLRGKLAGIGEIRINNGTNTFRVYLWLGCDPALYILDAGMKKSPTGSEIPKWQQDRLADRRDRAAADCKHNHADLNQAFLERVARRDRHQQEASR